MNGKVLVWDGGLPYGNYIRALEAVGLEPLVSGDAADAARCAALLLPGGGDVGRTLPEEETRVIARFLADGRPVLGICRGLQALNVYLGGTLYDYVPRHQASEDILHDTDAVGDIAALLGTSPRVTSNHHQAVCRLGRGLTVCQWAADGVVEGVCHSRLPLLAVQWHPERQSFALRRPDAADGAPVFHWLRRQTEKAARG